MRVRRGFLGWGVFLILAGAVPLLVRSGYLTGDQVANVWTLWPLVLVGISVGLLLSRTRYGFLGGLIVAATFGLMVGGLLSTGVSTISTGSCGSEAATTAFPAQGGAFSGSSAAVTVQLNCGSLEVAAAQGSSWRVEGRDRDGAGPKIDADDVSLQVRSQDQSDGPFMFLGQHDDWTVTLPTTPTVDIDLKLNAGSSRANLGGARIGIVDLELNAGTSTVDLSEVAAIERLEAGLNAGALGITLPNTSMTGSIQANAGAVKLCAPDGVGLRLRTGESIIASYDYGGHGLVQDGSTWSTPGYDTAPVQIDLETRANAGSFTLNPAGGCD
jgi:hypothetical protein